jgi:hypothetical protein
MRVLCLRCAHCKAVDARGNVECGLGISGKVKLWCRGFEGRGEGRASVRVVKGVKGVNARFKLSFSTKTRRAAPYCRKLAEFLSEVKS